VRELLKAGSSAGAAGWLAFQRVYLLSLALEAGISAKLSVSGSRQGETNFSRWHNKPQGPILPADSAHPGFEVLKNEYS